MNIFQEGLRNYLKQQCTKRKKIPLKNSFKTQEEEIGFKSFHFFGFFIF